MLNVCRPCLLTALFATQFVSAQPVPPLTATAYSPSSPGYYFLSPIRIGAGSTFQPLHLILDEKGKVVYYKTFTGTTGDFKIHSNGLISYSRQRMFYLMDSTFTVIDSVSIKNGLRQDAHDFQILPNGHYLLMGYEYTRMDLSSYKLFNRNGSPGSPTAIVQSGVVQELDTNGDVVFEWHSKDHYSFDDVDEYFLNRTDTVDWTHFNAIDRDRDGNILVSTRHFNEITKISRVNSSIIWRLGGKHNQFSFENDPRQFKGQHDVRRIDNGNITLLDNGSNENPVHPVGGKEYHLDEALLTATLVWSYVEEPESYSGALGNVQRLPDGNTLINYGQTPSKALCFNVVDPNNSKVFDLTFSDTLRSYRVFNYPSLPWNLQRPTISCYTDGGEHYLDAGGGHSGYVWSNGDTSRTIRIAMAGMFQVFVPLGQGGFVGSEPFEVSNPADPCNVSMVVPTSDTAVVSLAPSPVTDRLVVRFGSGREKAIDLEIIDYMGRVVYVFHGAVPNGEFVVPVSELSSGVYLLRADGTYRKFIKL